MVKISSEEWVFHGRQVLAEQVIQHFILVLEDLLVQVVPSDRMLDRLHVQIQSGKRVDSERRETKLHPEILGKRKGPSTHSQPPPVHRSAPRRAVVETV